MLVFFRNRIKKRLPDSILDGIKYILFFLRKIMYFGKEHFCPVCQSRIHNWMSVAYGTGANDRCPVCFSLERHRLDWLFISRRTGLLDGSPKQFLHIAPEPFFIRKFQGNNSIKYITGDLNHILAMVRLDLRTMPFCAHSFDAIYCSHVLEHIQDDTKAIGELFRVLISGGWAVLQVPITVDKTFEDPAILEPGERERIFGQHDHVRRCGPDYVERMRAAGFYSRIFNTDDLITEKEGFYLGIQMNRVVIYCEKVAE